MAIDSTVQFPESSSSQPFLHHSPVYQCVTVFSWADMKIVAFFNPLCTPFIHKIKLLNFITIVLLTLQQPNFSTYTHQEVFSLIRPKAAGLLRRGAWSLSGEAAAKAH